MHSHEGPQGQVSCIAAPGGGGYDTKMKFSAPWSRGDAVSEGVFDTAGDVSSSDVNWSLFDLVLLVSTMLPARPFLGSSSNWSFIASQMNSCVGSL